jgi:AcrR family transcriptional regulator
MLEASPSAEKILQVAIEILARKGYSATSTREIVEAAGVTKPMLYYYFGNKAGVCQAGIRRISEDFFGRLEGVFGRDHDPRARLVDFVWTNFEFMRDHHDASLFFMSLFFGPERQQFKDDFETVGARMREMTGRLVQQAIAGGVLRSGCEEGFSMAIHGCIDAWHKTSICDGIELSPAVAEHVVDDLLVGFGVR